MMVSSYKKWMLILSGAGTLFSGYLSATKFFTKNCALSEPCPSFIGYPACYFGFGLFLILFLLSLLIIKNEANCREGAKIISFVSMLGVLFAFNFTYKELPNILSGSVKYGLGLPTCAYGLIFFLAVFIFSFYFLKKR